jgi:hypothetical protein
VVFVVGGGVAQGLVQAHGVVVHATQVRFLFQLARVGDLVQVWVLAFEVAEERLDPGWSFGVAGHRKVGGDAGPGP